MKRPDQTGSGRPGSVDGGRTTPGGLGSGGRHRRDGGKGRVLIVDDESTLRLGLSLALRVDGYEVEEAPDGARALRRLTDPDGRSVDAVILDLRMPGMGGLEVVEALAERDLFVPTVLLSAHIDPPTAVEAIGDGVVDFLKKPVTPGDVRGAVATVLDQEALFARLREQPSVRRLRAGAAPGREREASDPVALARCRLRRRDRVGARSELERGGVHAPRGEAHFWRLLIDHLDHLDQRATRPDVVTGFSRSPFFQASDLLDRLAHNGGS